MKELHLTDDVLEAYALGRMAPCQRPAIEQHLLVCEYCQDQLAFLDDLIVALREVGALAN